MQEVRFGLKNLNFQQQWFSSIINDMTFKVYDGIPNYVYLDNSGNASITAEDINGGSTDNIGIASFDLDKTSFNCSEIGDNIVTLTVSDAAGNTDNCVAVVTVLDESIKQLLVHQILLFQTIL